MSDKPNTEVEAIADLADEAGRFPEVVDPSEIRAAILRDHDTERVEIVDLEDKLSNPRRKNGTVAPTDVASFVAYTKEHHDEAATTVWIDRDAATITSIFNDHVGFVSTSRTGTPGWGDHKARLALVRTPEWAFWKGADGKWFSQQDFAEHVQQGLAEIVIPEAAVMLEVAQSLQGKTDANWQTARRLDNGEVSFSYTETLQATAGRAGNLEVPSEFTLNVIPFYGEDAQPVDARLRYRVREGNLTIGYQLIRPHEVELAVLRDIQTRLGNEFPRVYMGKPRG